eukprot:CAMPEP_0172325478 /NCGR_PEP_ID=MMETSP1058-20130122/54158_1 /TAXON_ID=83371 /ORGANISM="Detonula confervacea, Strain CCMP 353" /LENGTH=310 /DNA_ID=CAMNT_0013042035 /DNA_START=83 /DNA_END=1015 /DNA_ORIENTATION=+
MPKYIDLTNYGSTDTLALATFSLYALAIAITLSALSKRKAKPNSSIRERRRLRILFKNSHGISGILSTLLTCVAMFAQKTLPSSVFSTSITSVCAVIASVITASSGMSIVDQAPKQTVVMEYPFKVVPPHRDAFTRTGFSIYYLSARIFWNTAKTLNLLGGSTTTGGYDVNAIDWVWGCIALCYAVKYFLPRRRDVDWTNGNTYIFVVPMAVGLTADAVFQLPILQSIGETCWNDDVITQLDLLCVLLSGLVVAFVFTLAFRGVLGLRKCYWSAALVVHGIVAYLISKALPFVGMQIMSSYTQYNISLEL